MCIRDSTLHGREAFKTAPVLMDYRRSTVRHPEDNCEYYNRMLCRSLARERKQPVIAFDAVHEGISHEQGMAMEESHLNGLQAHLELCDEARGILTQNINPGVGLMNGTQVTVKHTIYAPGNHPNHDTPALRLPACILLDIPTYTGPAPSLTMPHDAPGSHSSHARSLMQRTAVSRARSFHSSWVGLSHPGRHKA